MANELSFEKSPYLLQHATNPVHWKAWGPKAFDLAKKQDLPIFLSIGYSTCHWCHVMEKQSFERQEIADFLNKNFVSIKVDREELPEVDALYMEALQVMNQRGGWPLNIFIDHDLRPFYGGTYFPPQNFFQLLNQLTQMWQTKRDEMTNVSSEIQKYLTQVEEKSQGVNVPNLKTAFLKSSQHTFDLLHGGHKGAPKFPMNYEAIALFRFEPGGDDKISDAEFYLEKMLSGGIWDHVGGGIHRYSTDEEWRVPHFEKMLYDQASLLSALSESLMQKENLFLRKRAETLLDYLERDLKMPAGAFYAAEDADSEGVEGKFYVWTHTELKKLLNNEEFSRLEEHFEIKEEGNWEHNIVIHAAKSEIKNYSDIWQKLLPIRSQRPRPIRDEKVICAWNGLMISALARYARTTTSARPLRMANEALDFLETNLFDGGKLRRRWIQGEAKFEAQLEDYAFLIEGLRELYVSGQDLKHLTLALKLQDTVNDLFWREERGYISNSGENVWRENQEFSDNVTPSAVSSTHLNLFWLSEVAMREDYLSRAQKLACDFGQGLLQFPIIYPRQIEFYDLIASGVESVAIILKDDANKDRHLRQLNDYNPKRIVFASSNKAHPLLKDKPAKFSEATYYICKNKRCSEAQDNYDTLKI